MKRRFTGLAGFILWVTFIYLIWQHLSGGEGLTRNLARNTLLGISAPWGIYCLVLLFGKPKTTNNKTEE